MSYIHDRLSAAVDIVDLDPASAEALAAAAVQHSVQKRVVNREFGVIFVQDPRGRALYRHFPCES